MTRLVEVGREKSEPDELWTLDYMHGPKIPGMKSTPACLPSSTMHTISHRKRFWSCL